MDQVMGYLHNYFYKFKEKGRFKIEFNGLMSRDGYLRGKYVIGQYIKIVGSANNDGVYRVQFTDEEGYQGITLEGCLMDEEFEGYICGLSVPRAFTELCESIESYNKENKRGGLISESFGGYSYSRASSSEGGIATWKDIFKDELRPYRRMTDGFKYVKEVK